MDHQLFGRLRIDEIAAFGNSIHWPVFLSRWKSLWTSSYSVRFVLKYLTTISCAIQRLVKRTSFLIRTQPLIPALARTFRVKLLQNQSFLDQHLQYHACLSRSGQEVSWRNPSCNNFSIINKLVFFKECGPIKYHPAWRPKDADWFDQGHTDTSRILFGSYKPFVGTEHVQNRSMLFGL